MWDYVIKTSPEEILKLPLLGPFQTLNDLPASLPQEAKWLIGWWLAYAIPKPRNAYTNASREALLQGDSRTWTKRRRELIACTASLVKHWKIHCASYDSIEATDATWFIDPPYQCKAGRVYTHNDVNFEHLSEWCKSRQGQVIVCENADSKAWLPFEPFCSMQGCNISDGNAKFTKEVWWTNTKEHLDIGFSETQYSLF